MSQSSPVESGIYIGMRHIPSQKYDVAMQILNNLAVMTESEALREDLQEAIECLDADYDLVPVRKT